jgi:two-component system NtrC family sensor kinase
VPRGLAQKLIVSLTLIVILIGAVFGMISVKSQERQLLNTIILGADQLSKAITSATWHAMLADNRQAAYEVMQTIAAKQGIDRIRIFNREGRVMFSTQTGEVAQKVDKSAGTCSVCHASLQPRVHVEAPSRVRILQAAEGRRSLTMVTPIYNEPSCSQAACHAHPAEMKVLGVLDVVLNLDPVDTELARIKARVFVVTAAEVVLISVFVIFFTRRFLSRPIRKLIDGTKAVSAMELDKPIEINNGSEELDQLAHSFDVMRGRLNEAVSEINQFTQKLETKVEQRTEQLKTAHKKLMQSDRLASLGTLAASVAHEINNPVSGVLNLSMLMQRILKDDGIPEQRIPEFRKYLSQVVNETSRVGRIVSDLLAFSRRSKPQRAEADLNRIVNTTVSLIAHKLKLSNVEIVVELEEQLPLVHCDASQIQQVVLNLLLNGAEAIHSKEDRRLAVRTSATAGREEVILSVSDTGEGIPKENLAKIFDPFFTTKPEGKGVGLGLAVLYGIVQAHGGEVSVDSKPGQGATFTVVLPVSPAPPGEAPVAEALVADGS